MFLVLPFLRPPLYGLRRNFLCHALCKSYALHEHQKVFLFLRFKFPQKSHDLCCFLLVSVAIMVSMFLTSVMVCSSFHAVWFRKR